MANLSNSETAGSESSRILISSEILLTKMASFIVATANHTTPESIAVLTVQSIP